MLDKNVFFEQMEVLISYYPSWSVRLNEEHVARLWYEQFDHMENKRFKHMIKEHIKNERFNPTVKSLLENDTLPVKSVSQQRHEQALKEYGYYD